MRTFCSAATVLEPEGLYWAGRLTLLCRPEHIPVYDEVFGIHFGSIPGADSDEAEDQSPDEPTSISVARTLVMDGEGQGSASGTASQRELLQYKSFSECTEDEWSDLAALLAELPRLLPLRRVRRYERGKPGSVDIHRLLRSARQTGGDPLRLQRRRRRAQPRPIVLLLDVSGSMAVYSRALLLFAHAVARSRWPVRVYAFGTRLTDITAASTAPTFQEALEVSETAVPDWEGGTRIGDALGSLLVEIGQRTEMRRAVLVICSDGLDTGPRELVALNAERLRRTVHRVVWLNPLKEDPRYRPLAGGMSAALPHIDLFQSGHSVSALKELFTQLGREELSPRRFHRATRPRPPVRAPELSPPGAP